MGVAVVTTMISNLRTFVCTDLTVHSECCNQEEGCECDLDSHNQSQSPAIELEVKKGEAGYEMHVAKN